MSDSISKPFPFNDQINPLEFGLNNNLQVNATNQEHSVEWMKDGMSGGLKGNELPQTLKTVDLMPLAPICYNILPKFTVIEYEPIDNVRNKRIIYASQKEHIPGWLREILNAKCLICQSVKRKNKIQFTCGCYADEDCIGSMKYPTSLDLFCPEHKSDKIDKHVVKILQYIYQDLPKSYAIY